jgi:hypothetical protein
MEPITIALTAATLIATKFAERLGDDMGGAVTTIFDAVRRRFAGDSEMEDALTRLEAKPESEARTKEVAELLETRVQREPAFAAELEQLIGAAEAQQGDTKMVTVIRDQARVGKVTTIGSIHGDVSF